MTGEKAATATAEEGRPPTKNPKKTASRSTPVWAQRLLRWAGRLGYLALLVLLLGLAAYVAFNLFVRSGVTPVPDLAGLREAEANSLLADHGLKLRRRPDQDDFHPSVATGTVLRHTPGPRTLVKRGSQVDVSLSLGPQVIEVPDVTGQGAQAAQVTLAAAGLALGRSLAVVSDQPPGLVVMQQPAAGQTTAPDAAVDLLVSRQNAAETFVMPDLVYRRAEFIRRFFEQRSFQIGSVKYEVYEGIPEGVILRQFPLAGHPLRRQDAISLVVSTTEGQPRP